MGSDGVVWPRRRPDYESSRPLGGRTRSSTSITRLAQWARETSETYALPGSMRRAYRPNITERKSVAQQHSLLKRGTAGMSVRQLYIRARNPR